MAALPLIRMENGKWELHSEGAALLETVAAPMRVVAVAGMYRTGKSFFLNTLAGSVGERATEGFGVGSTSESCTRGIDVIVTKDDTGASLVLLDTEGLSSMEQDESYDAQIFALALLLSSYFVLNAMSVIDEAALDRLYLIGELSKHICVSAAPSADDPSSPDAAAPAPAPPTAEELSSYFPPFLWLLRDFVVDLCSDGVQVDETTYMEKALESRPNTARRSAERNETRAAIRGLFPARTCRTLVRPVADERALRQAVTLSEEQLRPEFVGKMREIKQEVLSGAPPKSLYGERLDGRMLLALASRYLAAMNSPGVVPSIRSAWESVVERRGVGERVPRRRARCAGALRPRRVSGTERQARQGGAAAVARRRGRAAARAAVAALPAGS